MMRSWLFLLLLIPSLAFAVVESDICGDGLEGDTEGANTYCTGAKDEDRDGYCRSGSTGCSRAGTDCDDNDRQMFVGQYSASGCSANEYKECQSGGTYTSCSALSTFDCSTGSGITVWFATTGNNSSGSGTYASPYLDYRIFSDSGETNYRNPVAGDCYVFRGGTYSAGTWDDSGTDRMLYLNAKSGTASNPIIIRSAPGETAVFQGGGTSPTEVWTMYLLNSDYIHFFDFEIDGSTGYSNNGIFASASDNIEITNVFIYDIDGEANNNLGAVKFSAASLNWIIQNSRFRDNYERGNVTDSNNAGSVISFESQGATFRNNVVWCTVSGGCGEGVRFNKHGGTGYTTSTITENVIHNFDKPGITNTGSDLTITKNFMELVGQSLVAITYVINDTVKYGYEDGQITNNTILRSGFYEFTRNALSNPTIGNPSLDVNNNVVTDDDTTYAGDGTEGFIRVGHYGSNTQKSSVDTAGVYDTENNCYYNSVGTIFMTYFGANDIGSRDQGATYSGLSAMQTAGFESGTVHEDPSFDSIGNATSSNCNTKGWQLESANPADTTGGGGRGRGRGRGLRRK